MKELITPHRHSFSRNANKHCIVLKKLNGDTEIQEGTVDIADDCGDLTPNQSSVENPSNLYKHYERYRKSKPNSLPIEKTFRTKNRIKDNRGVSNKLTSPTSRRENAEAYSSLWYKQVCK